MPIIMGGHPQTEATGFAHGVGTISHAQIAEIRSQRKAYGACPECGYMETPAMPAEEIARYIVSRVEKEENEGHGAYCNASVDGLGFEYDGHLNVLEIVNWVIEKARESSAGDGAEAD